MAQCGRVESRARERQVVSGRSGERQRRVEERHQEDGGREAPQPSTGNCSTTGRATRRVGVKGWQEPSCAAPLLVSGEIGGRWKGRL